MMEAGRTQLGLEPMKHYLRVSVLDIRSPPHLRTASMMNIFIPQFTELLTSLSTNAVCHFIISGCQ